jgi:hypothetical protein
MTMFLWLMAEAYSLDVGGYLLLCVVGTADERAGFDVGEAKGPPLLF